MCEISFLCLHWRHRYSISFSVFQKCRQANSAAAPLILYLERSRFHSMPKSVPCFKCFIFVLALLLLELSLVSAALPSAVFLIYVVMHHIPTCISPKEQKFWGTSSPHLYDFRIPSFYQLRFLSNDLISNTFNAAGLVLLEIIYPASRNSNAICEIQAGCLSSAVVSAIFFTIQFMISH